MARPVKVSPGTKGRSHFGAEIELHPRRERRDPAIGETALGLRQTALRNIAPPERTHPSDRLTEEVELKPLVALLAARTCVLVATSVMTLGWLIWKTLAVVVSLPQSTFTPTSNCVDL
jgi:hypothetical protein